jgi:small GTP-binding protein
VNKLVIEKKILLLGSSAVGKTTTFKSLLGELLDVGYIPSLSINVGYKLFEMHGKQVGLRIWDLGGQLLHRQVWKNYYANTEGCLLIYDITRKSTFTEIQNWKREMSMSLKKKIPIILIGNKCDLESQRQVSFEEGNALKKKVRAIAFFETSALHKINLNEVVEKLLSSMFK